LSPPLELLFQCNFLRFKTALKKFFKKQQKAVIFFERNYRTMHMQIQVVPVPASQASAAKPTFQVNLQLTVYIPIEI